MAKAKKLPTHLSAGILVALKDLAKVEASDKYVVNMGTWHTPEFKTEYNRETGDWESTNKVENCQVCFAGAVMARTLKTPIADDVSIYSFSSKVRDKLTALDSIRCGDVSQAIYNWYGYGKGSEILAKLTDNPLLRVSDDEIVNVEVTDYDTDPAQWRIEMTRIAKGLEALGY